MRSSSPSAAPGCARPSRIRQPGRLSKRDERLRKMTSSEHGCQNSSLGSPHNSGLTHSSSSGGSSPSHAYRLGHAPLGSLIERRTFSLRFCAPGLSAPRPAVPPNIHLKRHIVCSAILWRVYPLSTCQTECPCAPTCWRIRWRAARHPEGALVGDSGAVRRGTKTGLASHGKHRFVTGRRVVDPVARDVGNRLGTLLPQRGQQLTGAPPTPGERPRDKLFGGLIL
jgi:hypothetical protein